jgi:hypothetical protein
VRLPGCVDEAKNADSPHDAFSLFISDDILNIILTNTNKRNHDYLLNLNTSEYTRQTPYLEESRVNKT